MDTNITIPALGQMKRDGRKSVGVVAWDYQIARIADRAGVDFVSVGDSVGVNLWGHANPLEVTLDEMLVCCKAVRRGVTRALVSCDVPFGPVQEGVDAALRAAIRLVKEGGAILGFDAAADFPTVGRSPAPASGVRAVRAHPADRLNTASRTARKIRPPRKQRRRAAKLVEEAKMLVGWRSRLDFTNSSPVAGAAVVRPSNPVIGGFGGGPWLMGGAPAHTAIGYAEKWIDSDRDLTTVAPRPRSPPSLP
jgi:3-methyl-2-oxobutanoate hydroxymethyltransferase